MISVLEPPAYEVVHPLLREPAAFNVIIDAVIDGSSPAWVAVDDPAAPTAVFMATAEGHFLAGDPGNTEFIADFHRMFSRAIDEPGYWRGSGIALCFSPDSWADKLADIFPVYLPEVMPRHHFICEALAVPDWRDRLPDGFAVERIDRALLDRPGLDVPEHVTEWMGSNWDSAEDFLARGFGFAVIHQNAAVSWTLADCVSGERCEIGIQTQPDYRRRGLATLVVLAAVEYALARGLKSVGWHCHADNAGSIGVATKAGFLKERDYAFHLYIFEEARRRKQG